MVTISDRRFCRRVGAAKRVALRGPVFVTHLGQVAYVLMSIRDYRRLEGRGRTIADLLAMPGADEIEIEFPKRDDLAAAAEF